MWLIAPRNRWDLESWFQSLTYLCNFVIPFKSSSIEIRPTVTCCLWEFKTCMNWVALMRFFWFLETLLLLLAGLIVPPPPPPPLDFQFWSGTRLMISKHMWLDYNVTWNDNCYHNSGQNEPKDKVQPGVFVRKNVQKWGKPAVKLVEGPDCGFLVLCYTPTWKFWIRLMKN